MVAEVYQTGGGPPRPVASDVRPVVRGERAGAEDGNQGPAPAASRPVLAGDTVRDPDPHPRPTGRQIVTEIREVAQRVFRDLRFSVDEQSGEVVVKVVDRSSGEVLRQIPAEELLELGRALSDLQEDRDQALKVVPDRRGESGGPGPTGILIRTKA
jgi:flagellar protein FlaG